MFVVAPFPPMVILTSAVIAVALVARRYGCMNRLVSASGLCLIVHVISGVLAWVPGAGVPTAADAAVTSAMDVSAIRAVDAAYVKAVMARDWDKFAALLTTNVVVMPPNEPTVVGREANLARVRSFNVASLEYAHMPGNIAGERSVAYLQGTYTIRMTFPGAPQPFVDRGKYLWILRKQATGAWLIDRIIWNTDSPRENAG
jgi:ketosteroid isomerase-like protein